MSDALTQVRAALNDYRQTGPAYAGIPVWKVGLASRLMDSIMFTGDAMVAYLCDDGSVLLINDLGLAAHENDIVVPLYELFIEWGFPREIFFTPLHAVMEWLDCDEEEAIAIADQLDLEDLSLLTRRDYEDWVAYAAEYIPAHFSDLGDAVQAGRDLRERRDIEESDLPPGGEIPF